MSNVQSGEHWLAVRLTEVEAGARQVNVADMSEIIARLQDLAASSQGWMVHTILMRKVWPSAPGCQVELHPPVINTDEPPNVDIGSVVAHEVSLKAEDNLCVPAISEVPTPA